MRFKKTYLFLGLMPLLYANENIELNYLKDKPRGLEKDFFIWKNLNESGKDYSKSILLLGKSYNVTNELFFEYAKKVDHDETLAVAQCMQAKAKVLVDTNSDCIKTGLNLEKASTLSPLELDLVIEKTKEKYPTFAKKIKIINSIIPFTKIVSSNKDIIFDIYLNSTNKFLLDKLNYKLPKRTLLKIIEDKRFEDLLLTSISNTKLNYLQSSFLELDDSNLSAKSSFLLAMNRVLNKKFDEQTIKYLDNSYEKEITLENKEKILFWKFQLTKDENYLNSLIESPNINIYTLFAKEFLKKEILIPIEFNLPLNEYLEKCSNPRKIMINSMAKTLSKFDEKKINFLNLGLFQMNYTKAKQIAQLHNLEFNFEKLLEKKDSIFYFTNYLNEIESEFSNPLFQFFAYEEGIEIFKANLEKELFSLNNPYNLYLSFEIYENRKVSNLAKDFLVNYIYYGKLAKEEVSLTTIFEKIEKPLHYLD